MKSYSYLILIVLFFLSCGDDREPKEHTDEARLLAVIKDFHSLVERLEREQVEKPLIFQPFQNPPEERASSRELKTNLDVKFTTSRVFSTKEEKNLEVYHRSYNGQLVGSTWRIKPGDQLQVDVDNQLADSICKRDPLDTTHHHSGDINKINKARFNTTNLHVHGFHVSPKDHADNVFVEIKPGCNFKNRYTLPTDHAPGTFWYHGHVHGSTAIQVASGMAGAIIIEGGLDTIPEIKAMEEKIFVMQQMPFTKGSSSGRYHIPFGPTTFGPNAWKSNADSLGWKTTINGQSIPKITMAPGEVQRWRFIHAGVRETVNLQVVDLKGKSEKLEIQSLHTIAEDGIAYGYTHKVKSKLLQPGYRADFLFKAPSKEDDMLYIVDAKSDILGNLQDNNEQEPPKLLAVIVLQKRNGAIARKLPSQKSLEGLAPYPSLIDVKPTVVEEKVAFNIERKNGVLQFMINEKPFDPKNIRKLELNAVQDWELSSKAGDHPFHIHVNHFQIVEKWVRTCLEKDKKGKCKQEEWVHVRPPRVWKDTYFVRSDEITTIRTVYKDFTGKFVIHCHILDHEDQGMMQSVEIVEKLPKDAKTTSYTEGITVCSTEEKPVKAIPPD